MRSLDAAASAAHDGRQNPIAGKGHDAAYFSSAIVVAAVERSLCCASHRMLFTGGRARAAWSRSDLTELKAQKDIE